MTPLMEVVSRLFSDHKAREALLNDPEGTLRNSGLTNEERKALLSLKPALSTPSGNILLATTKSWWD